MGERTRGRVAGCPSVVHHQPHWTQRGLNLVGDASEALAVAHVEHWGVNLCRFGQLRLRPFEGVHLDVHQPELGARSSEGAGYAQVDPTGAAF